MAETVDTLKQAILDNAAGPKAVTGDAGSMTQHSLADQLAALDKLKNQQASAGSPNRYFRSVRMNQPGAV